MNSTEPKNPAPTGRTSATISLIVPAAGCGARAAQSGNKILAPLAGRPLLFHTLLHLLTPNFPASDEDIPLLHEVVIAVRRDEEAEIRGVWRAVSEALEANSFPVPQLHIVEGGASRQDSVLAAVRAARGDYVAVHDAARPFANRMLLERVWRAAVISGAAIAALSASDTVKHAISNVGPDAAYPKVAQTLDRNTIWLAQTPQVFKNTVLLEALEAAQRDEWAGTDCASAVERLMDAGGESRFNISLVSGDALNFKVTFAPDLARAEWMLRS